MITVLSCLKKDLMETEVPLSHELVHDISRVLRKPAFCICKNKGADQLHSNCTVDQRLCFRYTDSTIPLLQNLKFQASSHPSSVAVQPV